MRTLLLERDSDLARVFTEQSFFALSRETEVGWAERLGFTLEPGPGRARLHPPPQGEQISISTFVRPSIEVHH